MLLTAKVDVRPMAKRRGYYRIPKQRPGNKVGDALAEMVREKFRQGWPQARIARDFRLNRRTVMRICRDESTRREG